MVVCFDAEIESTLHKLTTPEIGLLIGRTKPRTEIYGYIRSIQEVDGVVDHGCMVNRSLPQGIVICGIYTAKNGEQDCISEDRLLGALKKIQGDGNHGKKTTELRGILLYYDIQTSKKRVVTLPHQKVTQEIKFTALLSLIPITCKYDLNGFLSVEESGADWKTISKQIIAAETKKLERSLLLVSDSNRPVDDFQTVKELPLENGVVILKLCLPFSLELEVKDVVLQEVGWLSGQLDCRVMAHLEDSVEDIIELLKMDVLQSLKTRLKILQEEGEEDASVKVKSAYLPRRAWYDWKGKAQLCEYLTREETLQDAHDSIEESFLYRPQKIDDLEKYQDVDFQERFWNPFEKKKTRFYMSTLHLNVLIGVVAILIGVIYYGLMRK